MLKYKHRYKTAAQTNRLAFSSVGDKVTPVGDRRIHIWLPTVFFHPKG